MPVPAPQPHDSQAIVVVIFFVAALCVRYWRLVVIILIALAVLGLIAGLHGLDTAFGQHLAVG
jgi:hypothetical protein